MMDNERRKVETIESVEEFSTFVIKLKTKSRLINIEPTEHVSVARTILAKIIFVLMLMLKSHCL